MFKTLADSVVGEIKKSELPLPKAYVDAGPGGLILFFTNVIRLLFVVAGIWAFVNLILAGFGYMTAGGDSKKLTAAWDRIWQTLMGLVIIVGSFVIISIASYILFGSADFILHPQLYGPKPVSPSPGP